MIPADALPRLGALDGRLSDREGRRLAELAAAVSVEHAIVDLGSSKGKGACYLGLGSQHGSHAAVYAIDDWKLCPWNECSSQDTFAKWRDQVSQLNLDEIVIPLRCESSAMSKLFGARIGLLLIGEDRSFESVERDFRSWEPHVVPGGVIAFHDYDHLQHGAGVRKFVDSFVASCPAWCDGEVVDSLYITRRVEQSGGREDRWTFVGNGELERHLRKRPPQYALDLSLVVPRRDHNGIYVDTLSPHYARLRSKYRGHRGPQADHADSTNNGGLSARAPSLPSADPMVDACFVWLYWNSGAAEDELRWSLRSVEKNYHGRADVVLVGDAPEWYTGRHLPIARVDPQFRQPYRDTLNKLHAICTSDLVPDSFIWIMDDTYLIRPVSFAELAVNRYQGELPPQPWGNSEWRGLQADTFDALRAESLPLVDYCTHLPKLIEKNKFLAVWDKYGLADRVLQWELLYGANFYESSQPTDDDFFRLVRGPVTTHFDHAKILNNGQKGWNERFRSELWNLFPDRSGQEAPGSHERPPNWKRAGIENRRYQFEIRRGYQDRAENNTGVAVPDNRQRNVYEFAASIPGVGSVVDLGTGSGAKLVEFFGDKATVGIDVAEKVEAARKRFPDRQWELPTYSIDCDLLICADVIEHLANPLVLIDKINAGDWRHCVISTPERDLARGVNDLGPPRNPRHVREWNTGEFVRLLRVKLTGQVESVQVFGQYNLTVLLTRSE